MRCNKNITLNLKNITAHFTGKEKIITLSLIIIMLSFVNITLSPSGTFYNLNVSALSYQTSTNIGFTFLPTLNVSLSSNNLTINNLIPGGNAVDSNTITVNVSTNIAEGYNLYATVGSNSSSNNNSDNNNNINNNANTNTNVSNGYNTANLVNTVDNNYTFIPLSSNVSELSNFANNNWGYSYSLDSGTTWISGDYGNASTGYNGLPLYTNTGIKLVEEAGSTSSTVDFKIAARAGSTQPSGEYANTINFTVISNTIPTTMLDAFIASGAQMYKGYFKMQDMTSEICKSIDVEESELQLIDIRDDKIYWVAKLADDNCWMTQNLDLDIVAGSTSLTSNNTDLSADESVYTADNTMYALKGAGDTYGYTYENSIVTWIPERTTIAYNQLNSTNWQNSNTDPYSWDRLKTSGANAGQPVYPDSNVTQAIAGDHGLSGNYYNWTASLASNDSTNATGNPTNSICPKGWRLPNATNKEFGNLLVQYNIISTNTSTSYIDGVSSVSSMGAAPLYFVRGGFVSGGSLSSSDNNGYYWSSTFYSGSYAYLLRYNSSIVKPQYDDGRYYGWPVRCLARSN